MRPKEAASLKPKIRVSPNQSMAKVKVYFGVCSKKSLKQQLHRDRVGGQVASWLPLKYRPELSQGDAAGDSAHTPALAWLGDGTGVSHTLESASDICLGRLFFHAATHLRYISG